jgi:hypothetical protein
MSRAMSLGPLDASLVPAGAELVSDAREPVGRPRGELLTTLRGLAASAAATDPRVHEDDEPALGGLARELQSLLVHAIETLAELRREDDGQREPEPIVFDEELDELQVGRTPMLSPPRLANVCFAGAFELGRVLRELSAARSLADVLVASETARRKLLRASRAVLDAAQDLREDEPAWRFEATDLRAALVVRRLYAGFRRALRRATHDDADAVLTAVRYAGGALATLVAAQAYNEARASDRMLLRRLHQRALAWARHDRDVTTGLQLLDDVWTTADLLRNINRRQELRAHDGATMRLAMRGPGDSPAQWLAQLDALVGIDDELDAAIARATGEPHPETLAAEISARLGQLR